MVAPMASVARIPFSPQDETVISTLNGWMLFLAIIHFIGAAFFLLCGCIAVVGAAGQIAQAVLGGIVYTLQMFTLPVLGAIMLAEGIFAIQARAALDKVVSTDQADQQFLTEAFKKLKLFFMLELAWFGVSVVSSLLGMIVTIVAPELAGPQGFDMSQTGDFGGPL